MSSNGSSPDAGGTPDGAEPADEADRRAVMAVCNAAKGEELAAIVAYLNSVAKHSSLPPQDGGAP